jgi:hypothetical protein
MHTTPQESCSICAYGDGKWRERQGHKMNDELPVCEKCKADGWTSDPDEILQAFKDDPGFSVGIKSPYENQ